MSTTKAPPAPQLQHDRIDARLEFLSMLYEQQWSLKADCLHCSYALTPDEVAAGFSADPAEQMVCCPRCREKFFAMLVVRGASGGRNEMRLYSPAETREILLHLKKKKAAIQQLPQNDGLLYCAALLWHGSLRGAFREVNASVRYVPPCKARRRKQIATQFLGRMPHAWLASASGLSIKTTHEKIEFV